MFHRADHLSRYNVTWTTPSTDMHGSMPIGNGDLAANVWVEPSGDLVFYLSKSDAWDHDHELLKVGRVRVRLDPPLVQDGARFTQELDLRGGQIVIRSARGEEQTAIRFWIDANLSVVNLEIDGSAAFGAQVTLETWRPDTVRPATANTICWYQRNATSIFAETLTNQHLGHLLETYRDPLINLTFGGLITGDGLVSKDERTLVTKEPTTRLEIRVHALTAQTPTAADWVNRLEAQRAAVEAVALATAGDQHRAYWRDFWDRSHLFVSGPAETEAVTRAYVLQRWIQSCAGRGAYPIKFNGSLFTVDGLLKDRDTEEVKDYGPDWRQWGGCYWFQNTREPYWAMLYAGDYDHMRPLWKMYRDALPLLKDRTRHYFKHDGIFCSETMYFWGLNRNNADYGEGNESFYPKNPYIRYYWDSGNELSMMMLDYHAHTGDDDFARTTLVPIADAVVTFYDQHHRRTDDGKVLFAPAASLETWHTAEDPLPVIVGLRTVLSRLLDLPASLTTPDQRERWQRFRVELPPLPVGEADGKQWLEPARTYSDRKNSENPELYAVFPYRTHAVGQPDLAVGLETWHRRQVKRTGGWSQDAIQAALLGLTDEARGYVVENATRRSTVGAPPVREPRFPAFWGPNFDWLPDQCQGSVTMIALQRMLMQCDPASGAGQAGVIRLLPAWPKDWNADFKLHAPGNTTVEGRVENGKLINLVVTPESRRQDVIITEAKP